MTSAEGSRSRASSGAPLPMILPTVETAQPVLTEPHQLGAISSAQTTGYQGSPAYRRHSRARRSMVFVPPRVSTSQADIENEDTGPADLSAQAVVGGASILAGTQVFAKLLTFVLNQMLLRFVDARDLGGSAQMDLLGTTVLSLARDSVRYAAQRETLVGKSQNEYRAGGGVVDGTVSGVLQETVNLGWVPLVLGFPLVILVETLYFSLGNSVSSIAALIYGASTLIELAAEPSFLVLQLNLQFKKRASIESLGIVVRCLVTFVIVAAGRQPILGYALGQFAYSLATSLGFYLDSFITHRYATFKPYPRFIWDRDSDQKFLLNQKSRRLAFGMYLQSLFKYLLAESDRLLVSFMLTLDGQGEYALAANYGSLFARVVLFPVEEALRSVFAKALVTRSEKDSDSSEKIENADPVLVDAQPQSPDSLSPDACSLAPADGLSRSLSNASARTPHPNRRVRSVSTSSVNSNNSVGPAVSSPITVRGTRHKQTDVTLAVSVLATTLRLYSYVGIVALAFGPLLSGYLLSFLVSATWMQTTAPSVVAAYICYIPVLSWNGALEALVQSVASVPDLKRQGMVMLALSVLFVAQAWLFMRTFNMGATGLVVAQATNMMLRIAWSLKYVLNYFSQVGARPGWLLGAAPSFLVSSVGLVMAGLARALGPVTNFKAFCADALLGASFLCVVLYSERAHVRTVLEDIRK